MCFKTLDVYEQDCDEGEDYAYDENLDRERASEFGFEPQVGINV